MHSLKGMEVMKVMDNVVNINRNSAVGAQRSRNYDLYLEQALFFAGALLTMVVPTIIYCAYQGPVPFTLFACSSLAGVGFGLVDYFLVPKQIISCVDRTTAKSARANNTKTTPPDIGATTKLAA